MTKGRNIIRTQQLLELAQAVLAFVAQTDETINPDLRDMRLIVEAINDYDSKLYAKSNSTASQEIPDYDDYDVEEEEEEEANPPSAKKAETEEGVPADVCAGYNDSLRPSTSAEAATDQMLPPLRDLRKSTHPSLIN
jgi:hypothetical protein